MEIGRSRFSVFGDSANAPALSIEMSLSQEIFDLKRVDDNIYQDNNTSIRSNWIAMFQPKKDGGVPRSPKQFRCSLG